MGIREAIIGMISSIAGSWPAAAAYLGMSEDTLRGRVYESKSWKLSTRDALLLQRLSGTTHFAEAIAAESHGVFIRLPEVERLENDSIQVVFNQHYAELGAMWTEFNVSAADGEITDAERARLQAHGRELHKKTEMLLALIFSVYCRRTDTVKLDSVREVVNG